MIFKECMNQLVVDHTHLTMAESEEYPTMAESEEYYPPEFLTALGKLLGTKNIKIKKITISSKTESTTLLRYHTDGSSGPSKSNPGIFVIHGNNNTWRKAFDKKKETKEEAFFFKWPKSKDQYSFWTYDKTKQVVELTFASKELTGIDSNSIFTVLDHHTYETISIDKYYVTFDPKMLKDNLPAKKTEVGQYEKFKFTSPK